MRLGGQIVVHLGRFYLWPAIRSVQQEAAVVSVAWATLFVMVGGWHPHEFRFFLRRRRWWLWGDPA